jgi:hypothetical protein
MNILEKYTKKRVIDFFTKGKIEKNITGLNFFGLAIINSTLYELEKDMWKYKNDINTWSKHYPLELAIIINDIDKIKLLLKHGAKCNTLSDGRSMINIALSHNDENIIILLTNNGGKLSDDDFTGKTAINLENEFIVKLLNDHECVICLDIKKIEVTNCGCTAKYCADCIKRIGLKCTICKRNFTNKLPHDTFDIVHIAYIDEPNDLYESLSSFRMNFNTLRRYNGDYNFDELNLFIPFNNVDAQALEELMELIL